MQRLGFSLVTKVMKNIKFDAESISHSFKTRIYYANCGLLTKHFLTMLRILQRRASFLKMCGFQTIFNKTDGTLVHRGAYLGVQNVIPRLSLGNL